MTTTRKRPTSAVVRKAVESFSKYGRVLIVAPMADDGSWRLHVMFDETEPVKAGYKRVLMGYPVDVEIGQTFALPASAE